MYGTSNNLDTFFLNNLSVCLTCTIVVIKKEILKFMLTSHLLLSFLARFEYDCFIDAHRGVREVWIGWQKVPHENFQKTWFPTQEFLGKTLGTLPSRFVTHVYLWIKLLLVDVWAEHWSTSALGRRCWCGCFPTTTTGNSLASFVGLLPRAAIETSRRMATRSPVVFEDRRWRRSTLKIYRRMASRNPVRVFFRPTLWIWRRMATREAVRVEERVCTSRAWNAVVVNSPFCS